MPRYSIIDSIITAGLLALALPAAAARAQPATPPAAPVAVPAAVVALPAFQAGMWEYRRSTRDSSGAKQADPAGIRRCSDPSRDIQQRIDELKQKGCRFSPLVKFGEQYESSWLCPANSGVIGIREVVKVASATRYETVSEIHHSDRTVRSITQATRIGECPVPGMTASPIPPMPLLPKPLQPTR